MILRLELSLLSLKFCLRFIGHFLLERKFQGHFSSGGELLELRLLDSHLLDTFGSKSITRHEIDKLLESS